MSGDEVHLVKRVRTEDSATSNLARREILEEKLEPVVEQPKEQHLVKKARGEGMEPSQDRQLKSTRKH
jgi:hypothetical protein